MFFWAKTLRPPRMMPMIDFNPIEPKNDDKPSFPDIPPGRRIAIRMTVLLVIATIGAWCLFLGWGVLEITQSVFLGIWAVLSGHL